MRNELMTPFWKNALASLPASVRSRYAADIAAAERWELRIDAACLKARLASPSGRIRSLLLLLWLGEPGRRALAKTGPPWVAPFFSALLFPFST
jgi:hypothetical protein